LIRQPDYVDYGGLEMVLTDTTADTPFIEWSVSESSHDGVTIPEFNFRTTLQVEGMGFVIVENSGVDLSTQLIPSLVRKSEAQTTTFISWSDSNWRKLIAAKRALELLFQANWSGIKYTEGYDPGFWRSLLIGLIKDLNALPVLFRYDRVKLKREQLNPDYEHLWLEFENAGLGPFFKPKLELRLAASMVKPGGFSRYPKIEFPLIEGKTKPFDSWYPETNDDFGSKLELRFSLDGKSFDTAVWASLSPADRALVASMINAFGKVLFELKQRQTSIARSWEDWIGLGTETAKLLQALLASASVNNKDKPVLSTPSDGVAVETSKVAVVAPSKSTRAKKEIVITAKKRSSKRV